VARRNRGGYCYQLNGAFSLLLQHLGYAVSLHRGGVHGPDGPSTAELGNHLVLVVHDLPDERSPDGRWYVDAGLGEALHEPLPLPAG
jgi:arylamine N-acetyltransferase